MKRGEFLSELENLFPNSFTESNRESWLMAYKEVLPADLNFKKLLSLMFENYKPNEFNRGKMPMPAWFKDFLGCEGVRPFKNEHLDKVEELKESFCPPPAETKQAIEQLKEKFGMSQVDKQKQAYLDNCKAKGFL